MAPDKKRSLDDFEMLFWYNRWATERVIETLRQVERPPDRAVELLAHLLRAQDVWFGRIEGTDHAHLSLWADEDLQACADRAESSDRRWRTLLERSTPDDLDTAVHYQNTSGTTFSTPLRDILSHVLNHGTHHRAQIALLLRQNEIAPPPTDYIFFVREQ